MFERYGEPLEVNTIYVEVPTNGSRVLRLSKEHPDDFKVLHELVMNAKLTSDDTKIFQVNKVQCRLISATSLAISVGYRIDLVLQTYTYVIGNTNFYLGIKGPQ